MEKELTKRIKNRIKELVLIKAKTSNSKTLPPRIDELQNLLGILHIHTTTNGTLIEKITELDDGTVSNNTHNPNWLGQVVTDTGELIHHVFDYTGICLTKGLSNKQRLDLSIENYGA